jgi:hypothetical protein
MGINFQNKLITGPDGCHREREREREREPKLLQAPPCYALGTNRSPLVLQGLEKMCPLYLSPDLQLEFDGNFQMGKY